MPIPNFDVGTKMIMMRKSIEYLNFIVQSIWWKVISLIDVSLLKLYLAMTFFLNLQIGHIILVEALLEFAVTVAPALLAEVVNSEIDKMKLCIVKQILICRGN